MKRAPPRHIILGLKDMAGVCPPRFMTEVVTALRKRWPELVLHSHRHMTDGLFVPSVGAAAKAGVQIVDTNPAHASAATARAIPSPPLPIWKANSASRPP